MPDAKTRQAFYKRLLDELPDRFSMPAPDYWTNPIRWSLSGEEVSLEGNPRRFIDPTHPDYTPSIYAEPSEIPTIETGQIIGVGKQTAKAIRKVLQNEFKARGKPPEDFPEAVSKALRGVWFRGEGSVSPPRVSGFDPKTSTFRTIGPDEYVRETARPTYEGLYPTNMRLGEPAGVSLTYKPDVASRFSGVHAKSVDSEVIDKAFRRLQDLKSNPKISPQQYEKHEAAVKKLAESYGEAQDPYYRIVRAHPIYGGVPEEVVLFPARTEHKEVLKEAYKDTLKEFIDTRAPRLKEYIDPTSDQPLKGVVDYLETNLRKDFNRVMSQKLLDRGYKAVAYSPTRYGEYELRVLDPKDVLPVETRVIEPLAAERLNRPAMRRFYETRTKAAYDYKYGMRELSDEGGIQRLSDLYTTKEFNDYLTEQVIGKDALAKMAEARKAKIAAEAANQPKGKIIWDESFDGPLENFDKIMEFEKKSKAKLMPEPIDIGIDALLDSIK